jgi:hypothetical protein
VTAVVAAVAVWVVAGPVSGVPFKIKSGSKTQHVDAPTVVIITLIAGLAAWGVVALLERSSASSPRILWTAIAVVVLALSLAGPFGSGITQATKVSLACEHLAVAAVLIPGMARTLTRR